jgi:succinylglutamate desuccinylase
MTSVYSKALNTTIETERIIGHFKGSTPGPTLIFIGGIHGNEPAGLFALHEVFRDLQDTNANFKGSMYGIAGNLAALKKGVRFQEIDLNRQWTLENLPNIKSHTQLEHETENSELFDIYTVIKSILDRETGPFYFFDLHTTSSETIPFITVNDSLLNRKFTQQFPVPMILGIEEYLEGPLLSYMNELGYVAFGFEGGQHDSISSVDNHRAFIYLSMVYTGSLKRSQIEYQKHYNLLFYNSGRSKVIYEIFWHYKIRSNEEFIMDAGFVNFQTIKKGQLIAKSNGRVVKTMHAGRIFMPLYQGKGNDGFFIIRKVEKMFLNLSAVLRTIRFDKVLPLLPGVRWDSEKKDKLTVNLKVARFFTKQFFHVLGYRSRQIDRTHLRMKNREAASRTEDYKEAPWMK